MTTSIPLSADRTGNRSSLTIPAVKMSWGCSRTCSKAERSSLQVWPALVDAVEDNCRSFFEGCVDVFNAELSMQIAD